MTAAAVTLIGLGVMVASLVRSLRWSAWLARLQKGEIAGWRAGEVLAASGPTLPAWFRGAPDTDVLFCSDPSPGGGPFRDGEPGVPVVRIPPRSVMADLLRARVRVRIAAIVAMTVAMLGALATGGPERIPSAVAAVLPHHAIERFHDYEVPGLRLYFARATEHGEGPAHGADVVGFDPRSRVVVQGSPLFLRAGRLPPAAAARRAADMLVRAADMLVRAAGSRVSAQPGPSIANGLLTFDLADDDPATPTHVVVALATGEVVASDNR
ncbi:MAG: hypothetical protein WCJ30_10850 [Deltaproteobacteria bacterium]